MITQEDRDSWPKYIAWTALAAFCTAVATKAGEVIVEKLTKKDQDRGTK